MANRASRKRSSIWAYIALAALLLAGVLAVSVTSSLQRRNDYLGDPLDRASELWAHKRLMARRGDLPLVPFESDGCSGGMSKVWRDVARDFPAMGARLGAHPPWEACCVVHDQAYYEAGGARTAEQSYAARRRSDAALRDCVAALDDSPEQRAMADAMYLAVRVGGGPCSGFKWRWGYGLPACW